MVSSILSKVRRKEGKAAEQEIAAWNPAESDDGKSNQMASDLEALAREYAGRVAWDQESILIAVRWAAGDDEKRIDEVNADYQAFLDSMLRTHDRIRELAQSLASRGYEVKSIAELNRASERYREMKDELPDQLMMVYTPAKRILQKRLREALKNPPTESDWERHFQADDSQKQ